MVGDHEESEDDSSNRNSHENEEDDDDESSKVHVYLKRYSDLRSQIEGLKARKESGKVLQIHVDPHHVYEMDYLKGFMEDIVEALPAVRKIEIATEETEFVSSMGRVAKWHVGLLTALLDKLAELGREFFCVRLCYLRLKGRWEDYLNLARSIQGLPSLEKFNLDKISLDEVGGRLSPPPGHQDCCCLDPVVQSLASLPRLQHLRILGTCDFGRSAEEEESDPDADYVVLQNTTLRQLCQSKSLRSLCLIHFNLSDDNVTHMAEQLETQQTLKELDIDCTLGTASSYALTRMMEFNPVLEDLNLCVRCKGDEVEYEINNNHDDANVIQTLIRQKEELLAAEDEINARLAQGVGKSTLVNFALFRGRLSPQSQDAFRNMMSKQYCLESLTLYTGDESLNKELSDDPLISFYCKLNQYGRRQLLLGEPPAGRWKATLAGNQQKSEGKDKVLASVPSPSSFFTPELCFVDTLARVKELSCLYYFISLDPAFCNRALEKINKEERDRHKKKRSQANSLAPPSKRTRLYRAAKYRGVCYK